MKKNRMMRLASVLLVCVLMTTSVISGTFAKYTTQDAAEDFARVAKWGVELQVDGNLYGDTYQDAITKADATGITVQSADQSADVIAPGTKNEEGFTFSLNGTPEVAGEVVATVVYENVYLNKGEYGVMVPITVVNEATFDEFYDNVPAADRLPTQKLYKEVTGGYEVATEWADKVNYFTLEDYVNLTDNYFPVEYKMVGGTTNDTSYNKDFKAALTVNTLEQIVAKFTKFGTPTSTTVGGRVTKVYTAVPFAPNEDLVDIIALEDQNITWKWDFCQQDTECSNGDAACMHCKADSILGQLMAKDTPETMRVVKLDGSIFKTPLAADGEDANDYNLESFFSIDITVTQVNYS